MVDPTWLVNILGIISLPYELIRYVVFSALDFLAFQVLQLGPYLPIQL
jgi:hypothetical protein